MNHHRDGQGQHNITPGRFNYWPNRASVVPPAEAKEAYWDYPEKIVGFKQRLNSKKFADHFSQAQIFWNSMTPIEQAHIINALCFELAKCDDPSVYENMVQRLADIALPLAQAVAEKVGVAPPQKAGKSNEGRTMKGLSMTEFTPEAQGLASTIATRMIAILIADGFNYIEYEAVKATLTAAGALVFTVGAKRSTIMSDVGKGVTPFQHFDANRSTMYDAVYIPGGSHVEILKKNGRAIHWIRESFGHCKAIGATGEAVELVRYACAVDEMKFAAQDSTDVVDSYGVVTSNSAGKLESLKIMKGSESFVGLFAWNISQHRNWQRELDGLTSLVAY